MSTVLRVSTHIDGVFEKIHGKTFIFTSKPRHVTPQIDRLRKTSTVLRVSTHISGDFQGDRWENMFIFQTKPRHVTPQIDCLGEMSTVLRVSTDIYGVSKELYGKTFIFRVNLGM